jgi:hypothetical protein
VSFQFPVIASVNDVHCDEMGILSKSANWADGEGLSMSRRPFENCLGRMF